MPPPASCRVVRGGPARWRAAAAAGLLVSAPVVRAQPPAPAPVALRPPSTAAPTLTADDRRARARVVGERGLTRGEQVALSGLVGAAAGAGVGALIAFREVHRPRVIDHSEDGLAYGVLTLAGAAVGATTGVVVGLIRTRHHRTAAPTPAGNAP